MRSTDPVRVRSVCQSGRRSALRRPWSPSASGVPTTTAERPSQPGRRQISARTQATKSIDSSYLRMLHHLGDYADPSSDCAGLSKDPFLRPSSTRTGRGAYVAYGSKAPLTERPLVADIVEIVFLGWRTKILRAADAFCAWRREGPHRFIQNRSRTSVVTLQSDAAAKKSKDRLS